MTPSLARNWHKHALAAWHTTALAVADCERLEIMLPLFERERAGLLFASWPDEIRALVLRTLEGWQRENPQRAPVAFSCGVIADAEGQTCVAILHHAPKPAPEISGGARQAAGGVGAGSTPSSDAAARGAPSMPAPPACALGSCGD